MSLVDIAAPWFFTETSSTGIRTALGVYSRLNQSKTKNSTFSRGSLGQYNYIFTQTNRTMLWNMSFLARATGSVKFHYLYSPGDDLYMIVVNKTLNTETMTMLPPSSGKTLSTTLNVTANHTYLVYFVKEYKLTTILSHRIFFYTQSSSSTLLSITDDLETIPGVIPGGGTEEGGVDGSGSGSSNISSGVLSANRVLITSSNLSVVSSTITATELLSLAGSTSNVASLFTSVQSNLAETVRRRNTDVSFGKAVSLATSSNFGGGCYYRQVSWDAPNAFHAFTLRGLGLGDHSTGTIYVQASNKSMVAPKIGNIQISFLKEPGQKGDAFIISQHKNTRLQTMQAQFEVEDEFSVVTDPDCSIAYTVIASM